MPLVGSRRLPLASVKQIAFIARKHMKMIMPDILPTIWLVVLSRRDAIARVSRFHRHSDGPGAFVDFGCKVEGQIVNVFVMLVRNNDHMPRVVRPLVRGDKSCDRIIVVDCACNVVAFVLSSHATKRANIVLRCIVVHASQLTAEVESCTYGSIPSISIRARFRRCAHWRGSESSWASHSARPPALTTSSPKRSAVSNSSPSVAI